MTKRKSSTSSQAAPPVQGATQAASAAADASANSGTEGAAQAAPAGGDQAANQTATDQAASAPVSGETPNTSDDGVADAGGDQSGSVVTGGDQAAADPFTNQAAIAPDGDANPTPDDVDVSSATAAGGDQTAVVAVGGDQTDADNVFDNTLPNAAADTSLYEVLTPFKFRGFPVKPPAWIELTELDALEYQLAGVLGWEPGVPPSQDVE